MKEGFFSRGNMAEILDVTFDTALNNWRKVPFVIIGAITAEKLEGTSRHVGWMPIPLVFLLGPFPVSRYCSAQVSPIPSPTLLSFST